MVLIKVILPIPQRHTPEHTEVMKVTNLIPVILQALTIQAILHPHIQITAPTRITAHTLTIAIMQAIHRTLIHQLIQTRFILMKVMSPMAQKYPRYLALKYLKARKHMLRLH